MPPGSGATSYTDPAGSLEHLEVERRRYLASALATTSQHAYQTALTQYLHFCIQVGVNPYPLQEYILEAFSTSLTRRVGYKIIKSYLSGIQFHGIIRGHHHKITDMLRLRYILRGIRRTQGARHTRPRRRPITLAHITTMYEHAPTRRCEHVESGHYRRLFRHASSIRIHLQVCAHIRRRKELDAAGCIRDAPHGPRTY